MKPIKELKEIFKENMCNLPFLREKSKSSLLFKIMYIESQVEHQKKVINNLSRTLTRFKEELKILIRQLEDKK